MDDHGLKYSKCTWAELSKSASNIPVHGWPDAGLGWRRPSTANISAPVTISPTRIDLLASPTHRHNCTLQQGGEGWWTGKIWLPPNSPWTNRADLLQPVYLQEAESVVVEFRGCLLKDMFQCSLDKSTGSQDPLTQSYKAIPDLKKTYLQLRLCFSKGNRQLAPWTALCISAAVQIPLFCEHRALKTIGLTICQVFSDYFQYHSLFLSCEL